MYDKKSIGRLGEELAERFLQRKGYTIIEKNFHTRFGEIDIVARQNSAFIFVEVKTRTSTFFGSPEESITPYKQERWKKSVWVYCQTKNLHHKHLQFDVIAILLNRATRTATLRHFKNIEI